LHLELLWLVVDNHAHGEVRKVSKLDFFLGHARSVPCALVPVCISPKRGLWLNTTNLCLNTLEFVFLERLQTNNMSRRIVVFATHPRLFLSNCDLLGCYLIFFYLVIHYTRLAKPKTLPFYCWTKASRGWGYWIFLSSIVARRASSAIDSARETSSSYSEILDIYSPLASVFILI